MRGAELGQQQLDWFKNWYETTGRAQETQEADLNKRVIDQSMGIAADQNRIANETYDYQKGTFRPLEQGIVADAQKFNAADYGDRKAAEAAAGVESAVAQAQAGVNRDMARRGVAPSAGVSAALAQDAALRGAAMKAGAATTARDTADPLGFARRMDAASLGRGLAGQNTAAATLALNAGGQSAGVLAGQGNGVRANTAGIAGAYQGAVSANQGAASILNSQYATQAGAQTAANASKLGVIGTILGAGAGFAART
jgi:hypothetical protein